MVTPGVDEQGGVPPSAISEAEGFVALYEAMTAPGSGVVLWTSRGHRIGFEDVISVSVSQSWSLNSAALLDLVPVPPPRQLVPVVEPYADAKVRRALVRSLRGTRIVETAPPHAVRSLVRTVDKEADEIVAVSLDHDEYIASPEVTLTAALEGVAPVEAFRFRFLLPVSQVQVDFEGGMPLEPFHIDVPEFASLDHVAVSLRMSWEHIINGIDDLISAQHDQARLSDEVEAVDFVYNINNGVSSLRNSVRGLRMAIDEISAEGLRADGRPLGHRRLSNHRGRLRRVPALPKAYLKLRWVVRRVRGRAPSLRWTRDLRAVERLLASHLRSSLRRPDLVVLDQEVEKLRRLRNEVQGLSARFTVILPVRRSVVAATDDLANVLRHEKQALPVKVQSLLVPFSTEREPGTQGTRSMILLATLGVLLLVLAAVDLSWLPVDLWGLRDRTSPENPIEALVALLVIFPAALYSQFFQTRPTTHIGHRAQLGTFSVLSLVFAMPLMPAVLAGAGVGLEVVSLACVLVALVALLGAAVVKFVFTRRMLSRLRLGQAYRWKPVLDAKDRR